MINRTAVFPPSLSMHFCTGSQPFPWWHSMTVVLWGKGRAGCEGMGVLGSRSCICQQFVVNMCEERVTSHTAAWFNISKDRTDPNWVPLEQADQEGKIFSIFIPDVIYLFICLFSFAAAGFSVVLGLSKISFSSLSFTSKLVFFSSWPNLSNC